MGKRWKDGPVSGGGKYFCHTRHPAAFDWRNTPWSCPECGLSVAKLEGPPRGKRK